MREDSNTKFYALLENLIGWTFLAGWLLTIIGHCWR